MGARIYTDDEAVLEHRGFADLAFHGPSLGDDPDDDTLV
jgi:hypothetical protein